MVTSIAQPGCRRRVITPESLSSSSENQGVVRQERPGVSRSVSCFVLSAAINPLSPAESGRGTSFSFEVSIRKCLQCHVIECRASFIEKLLPGNRIPDFGVIMNPQQEDIARQPREFDEPIGNPDPPLSIQVHFFCSGVKQPHVTECFRSTC